MPSAPRVVTVALLLCGLLIQASIRVPAQNGGRTKSKPETAGEVRGVSEMRAAIERYTADRGSLTRSYPVAVSTARVSVAVSV